MLRVPVLSVLLVAFPALATPPGPLTDAEKQALGQIVRDPPPKEIVRNSHYWVSNEYRHDLFKERMTGLGGIHIGVGTDQNYLMAGWSRPDLLILMDFDTAIVRIHRAYKIAFEQSETPQAFYDFWNEENAKAVMKTLAANWGDSKDGKRTVKAFKVARPIIQRRLKRTLRSYGKRGVKTFLDDAEQYAHLRALWQTDRVIAVRGDLTADQCMQSIAKAAKDAKMTVRTVYMSNAPQYFDFKAQFKANMAALPFDEGSIFLHTLTRGAFGYADKYYHYNIQPALNFQAWLAQTRLRKLTQILRYRTPVKGVQGFSIMEKTPADMPPPRKRIKKRKKQKNLKK
jgi:hypothetical protein